MNFINTFLQFLLETFNTRELANLAWVWIALCFATFSPRTRSSVFDFLKSLFIWKFILIYVIVSLYIRFIVLQLEKIDLWDPSLLKDTIYWSVLSGLVFMFKMGQSKEPLPLLKSILLSSVQVSVIIQFISNLETFNFWIEFIAVPVIILFSGIYVFSGLKKEHRSVTKLLERLGTFFSIVALGYIIYFAVTNYEKYLNLETFKQFILPILLTVAFTPILTILNLIVKYEDIFTSLKRRVKSKKQYYYLLYTSLIHFNFNIKGLIRWSQSLTLSDMENRQSIKASMKRVTQQQNLEQIKPEYPDVEGWLPVDAKKFLIQHDMEIKDYQSELGDQWFGKSNKLNLSEDFMTGDCVYSIHGSRYIVKNVKLHFRAFDSSRVKDLSSFIEIVDALFQNSLHRDLPYKIRKTILNLANLEYKDDLGNVSLRVGRWKNATKGYDLYVDIKHWGAALSDESMQSFQRK